MSSGKVQGQGGLRLRLRRKTKTKDHTRQHKTRRRWERGERREEGEKKDPH